MVQSAALVVLVVGAGLMLTRLAIGVWRSLRAGYARGSVLVQFINIDQRDHASDLRYEE